MPTELSQAELRGLPKHIEDLYEATNGNKFASINAPTSGSRKEEKLPEGILVLLLTLCLLTRLLLILHVFTTYSLNYRQTCSSTLFTSHPEWPESKHPPRRAQSIGPTRIRCPLYQQHDWGSVQEWVCGYQVSGILHYTKSASPNSKIPALVDPRTCSRVDRSCCTCVRSLMHSCLSGRRIRLR